MDSKNVEQERLTVGREFIDSLDKLGFHATMALWIFSKEASQFLLFVVTDFFDLKGPIEVTRYVFAAYNAAALPQDMDPFNVQFCSPQQIIGRRLIELGSAQIAGNAVDGNGTRKIVVESDTLETQASWILRNDYHPSKRLAPVRAPKAVDVMRKWNRFVANVEKLAA